MRHELALERAQRVGLLLERAGAQDGAADARAPRHQLAEHERDLGARAEADDDDAALHRDRAQVARWETGGQDPSFENLCAIVEACGFVLKLEIAERQENPSLDAELETSLVQAPQQRVQSLLKQLGDE